MVGYSFAPEKTQVRVEGLNGWMARHVAGVA
jgi:hypothetical protein